MLADSVKMVQRRLRAPADIELAIGIVLRPVEDSGEFRPVLHIFKGHLFDRCAGDDQPVELAVFDLLPGFVKAEKMLFGRVFALIAGGAQQGQLDLQRRRAEDAGELGFRHDLVGHQV